MSSRPVFLGELVFSRLRFVFLTEYPYNVALALVVESVVTVKGRLGFKVDRLAAGNNRFLTLRIHLC